MPSTVTLRQASRGQDAFRANGQDALTLALKPGGYLIVASAEVEWGNVGGEPAETECTLDAITPLGAVVATTQDVDDRTNDQFQGRRFFRFSHATHQMHLMVPPPDTGYRARLRCSSEPSGEQVDFPAIQAIRVIRNCCSKSKPMETPVH